MAKKISFIEEIGELLDTPLNICEMCSYRELPVCPMAGTELCNKIRGA